MGTPVVPIRQYPVIAHLGEGTWGSLCEQCGEPVTGVGIGGAASAHGIHIWREHHS